MCKGKQVGINMFVSFWTFYCTQQLRHWSVMNIEITNPSPWCVFDGFVLFAQPQERPAKTWNINDVWHTWVANETHELQNHIKGNIYNDNCDMSLASSRPYNGNSLRLVGGCIHRSQYRSYRSVGYQHCRCFNMLQCVPLYGTIRLLLDDRLTNLHWLFAFCRVCFQP